RDLHDQTLADLRSLLLLTDQLPKPAVAATTPGGHEDAGSNNNGGGGNDSGGGNGQLAAAAAIDPGVFRAEIEAVSHEIRRICEDLSPSALENVGLGAALEWALTNAVAHLPTERKFEYELRCEDELEERAEFAPGVRMQVYRIAQEAINNVCRHAGARRVSLAVEIDAEAGEFRLTLEDDGRSFDARDPKTHTGRGLANIRARASLIEAEVAWDRRREGGTRFTLRKPGVAKAAVNA
nr:ATP-binding protein [Pyrinomonadaceae bacterium]